MPDCYERRSRPHLQEGIKKRDVAVAGLDDQVPTASGITLTQSVMAGLGLRLKSSHRDRPMSTTPASSLVRRAIERRSVAGRNRLRSTNIVAQSPKATATTSA